MIIIVDAYNILKYMYQDQYITEKQRTHFVQQLAKYGKKKGHELIVVFDGGPHGLSDRFVKKPVTIIYTGAQERADDFIIRSITKYKNFDVLIVSTDREITNRAEKNNIPYIDSHLFYTFVCAALGRSAERGKKGSPARKLHKEVGLELDALMESVEVPSRSVKDEDSVVAYTQKGKVSSKNERRIMSIVDKL